MDAFKVDLFALKSEGGSASATIDLGRARPFLAWGSVSMVDSLADLDRDNAFAFDIFTVDGNRTAGRVSGGDHWGPWFRAASQLLAADDAHRRPRHLRGRRAADPRLIRIRLKAGPVRRGDRCRTLTA